eukprot:10813032-Ditylum_brightwellii.AAC.1
MPESKTADDACTCTELSLEDSGVVAFVSSSDGFCSPVGEAGVSVVYPTSIAMEGDAYWVLASTE